MSTQGPFSLSVIIMTYNEEANLPRCLDSVQGLGDELFILDSFSTDATLDIARKYGARIEQHPFDRYIDQKKRLIERASHEWILAIDADEYLSPELRESIRQAKEAKGIDGYYCHRRNKIGDTWIRHGSWYPDRKIRLFDRRKVRIAGSDPHDEILPAPGAVIQRLHGDLMHLSDENISSRMQTIERHSTRAAGSLYAQRQQASVWRMLVKPCVRFVSSYFLRLGFMDGYYGWIIARSEAIYVWMREVKLWEMQKRERHGA